MAEVQTLTMTAPDQHQFNATLYPSDDSHAPMLIFLSALGTPARVYRRFGLEMVRHGVGVCTPDWRGIDSSSVRAARHSNFGYRHLVEQDVATVIKTLRQRFPNTPLWLGGHSLGGQMALLGAATNPDVITGVALIASGSVHLPSYPLGLQMGVRLLILLSRLTRVTLGYFPGARLGFGGREASAVMQDWCHVASTGKYQPQGSDINYERALGALNLPILALNFDADTWAPAQAAQTLLRKAPKSASQQWRWNSSQTAGIALDHFSWTKRPELVAPSVAQHMVRSTKATQESRLTPGSSQA